MTQAFCIFRDGGFFGPEIRVLQRCAETHFKGFADPLADALTGHANRFGNLCDTLAGMVPENDSRSLRFPPRRGSRIPHAIGGAREAGCGVAENRPRLRLGSDSRGFDGRGRGGGAGMMSGLVVFSVAPQWS
jgi:hypothetical protein